MEIQGKTVLVTGASSGIGSAIAKAMVQAGAAVVLLMARSENDLKKVAAEIGASGGNAHIYPVDLSNPDQVTGIAQRIQDEAGVPDIIINNAGSGEWKFLEDTSPKQIQEMMAVPYFAAAWVTRAFLPAMRTRNSGHIVNVSSVASRFVWPGATAYIAARWAIRGLTEALRADLYGSHIGVTLYESGAVETPYWAHNPGSRERIPRIGKMIPVLRPEEVAKAIVAGVRGNKRLIVIPFMMKVIYLQHALFPWAVQWLMTATGYRPKNSIGRST
jgi:short-subunit dehydrogenase